MCLQIFFPFVAVRILSLLSMDLLISECILSVKWLLPLHSSTEEGAREKALESFGDILLVNSCVLPLAGCLDPPPSLSWVYSVASRLVLILETNFS